MSNAGGARDNAEDSHTHARGGRRPCGAKPNWRGCPPAFQPHFLLNTLNAIAGLLADEPQEARRLVAALGDLLRDSLEEGPEVRPFAEDSRLAPALRRGPRNPASRVAEVRVGRSIPKF